MRRQIFPDELDALYRSIGKGIWQLQNVEDALHTLLAIRVGMKTPGSVAKERALEILAKYRASTLGTALRLVKENGALSKSLLDRLDAWKIERDWVVHRSVHENGADLYTDEGRQSILSRLDAFFEEGMALQRAVGSELADWVAAHGIDVKKAHALAERQLAALRGEHY